MSADRVPIKLPTVHQVSAGGVVVRRNNNRNEVVIIQTVPELRWQLPKGLIDEGESPETAALREVREEGGVAAEIESELGKIEYWFVADHGKGRTRYHKRVHFYLMRYVSGDVADHDHEVAEARWVSFSDAVALLAFDAERDLVLKAQAATAESNT